ncbi:MAG: hypothetical protein KC524_09655, partial [Gammaproteobacteria bacterium]|nr:hypothetical protein [Gammaproteobacteria bacterium]
LVEQFREQSGGQGLFVRAARVQDELCVRGVCACVCVCLGALSFGMWVRMYLSRSWSNWISAHNCSGRLPEAILCSVSVSHCFASRNLVKVLTAGG